MFFIIKLKAQSKKLKTIIQNLKLFIWNNVFNVGVEFIRNEFCELDKSFPQNQPLHSLWFTVFLSEEDI